MVDGLTLHEAFRRGDLGALKAALGEPADFPNLRETPLPVGTVLEDAIYHSPVAFILALLELGADFSYDDGCGLSTCCWTLPPVFSSTGSTAGLPCITPLPPTTPRPWRF